jgi:hypothetical protein
VLLVVNGCGRPRVEVDIKGLRALQEKACRYALSPPKRI